MRLLVTRPQPQAAQWTRALRERGVDAHALPLIAIEPVPDPEPVEAAWRALEEDALVVFVSPSAVACFFGAQPHGASWPRRLRAATPGPGSAAALRNAGVAQVVEPAADAPQFDSEALWRVLEGEEWRGARVLVVRGDGGRDWLADQLRACGADVRFVQAYRRALPVLDAPARALLDAALDAPAAHLWLFSSSQAIDHLVRLAPKAPWGRSSALATHPRIAAHARRLGFGRVLDSAPSLDEVAAAVQHGPLQSSAK